VTSAGPTISCGRNEIEEFVKCRFVSIFLVLRFAYLMHLFIGFFLGISYALFFLSFADISRHVRPVGACLDMISKVGSLLLSALLCTCPA
jgi:hypothetical protein